MPKKRKKKRQPNPPARPAESRPAEAVTVFRTTTLLATVAAEVSALITRGLLLIEPWEPVILLSNILLAVAVVTGLVGLVLTAAVLGMRQIPPPIQIVRFALLVFTAPIVIAVVVWLAS